MKLISTLLWDFLVSSGDEIFSILLEMSGKTGKDIFLLIFQILGQKSLESIEDDTINTQQVQQHLLLEILRLQERTEYGKKYDFASIYSVDSFCSIHPLTSYEDYRSIIDDIAVTGNYLQLVAEPIILLQQTAGTTGHSKLIPRTSRLASTLQKAFFASFEVTRRYYLKNKLLSQCPGLGLFNTAPTSITSGGIPKGLASSGIKQYKSLQKIANLFFSSPGTVSLIYDSETAYYCHWLFALSNPEISYLSANFASNIIEAFQVLEKNWKNLIDDLYFGTINRTLVIEPSIRNELESIIKPNRCCATQLEREFKKGFRGILPRIWSNLSYIQCITTGSMELYKEKIKFYAGYVPIYSGNLAASETWLGLNLEPQRKIPAYTITPHSAFFEFIPISEHENDNPNTFKLQALNIGEKYEIVVTTVAGLYRYRTGDIIKCVDYHNQSPTVEFLYRKGSLLNIAGEKVCETTIFIAINSALSKIYNPSRLTEYTTRINTCKMNYVLYLELSNESELTFNINLLAEEIDRAVSRINAVYANFRRSNTIKPLQVSLVKQDTFVGFKNKVLLTNDSNPQFKMPRLLKNSVYIDFIENEVIESSLLHK
ncbi:MAG: GH3 auxin-responsive promoter family protein [Cyanobacteria bacterium J06621_8]